MHEVFAYTHDVFTAYAQGERTHNPYHISCIQAPSRRKSTRIVRIVVHYSNRPQGGYRGARGRSTAPCFPSRKSERTTVRLSAITAAVKYGGRRRRK